MLVRLHEDVKDGDAMTVLVISCSCPADVKPYGFFVSSRFQVSLQ